MDSAIDLDRAEFIAAFPNIMSALLFGADGVRIKLDIPETFRHEATKLTAWQGKLLRVVITLENQAESNNETEKEPKGSSSKVDSGRTAIRRNQR